MNNKDVKINSLTGSLQNTFITVRNIFLFCYDFWDQRHSLLFDCV